MNKTEIDFFKKFGYKKGDTFITLEGDVIDGGVETSIFDTSEKKHKALK